MFNYYSSFNYYFLSSNSRVFVFLLLWFILIEFAKYVVNLLLNLPKLVF